MHEMSLAEGIVQLIEDAARTQGFAQVRAVWLEIGRLSSVEPEALRFSFDAVTRGTLADGARLEIVYVPGSAWCLKCSRSVDLPALYEACPHCGGYQVQVTGGTEMRVKELEVD
jgi:hydrogenase nickel incorporation protein HypA/HybF